jgi:predicted AlkP superfamily pyrophosphatase or phosphodiesterase
MMNLSFRRRPGASGRRLAVAPVALVASLGLVGTPTTLYATPEAVGIAATTEAPPQRGRVTDHVIVISLDGLRPDAIARFGARTLERLMQEGTFTLKAQTIHPSKTLPSHTSMLTGVDVAGHGIDWNTDQTDDHGHVDVPTVFGLARAQGFTTAAFFSKTKFHHLEAANTLDYARSPQGGLLDGRWMADRTVGEVEKYLESDAAPPNLMFVHIGEPDYAGHLFGWMSSMYGEAVREADAAVAEILEEAAERFGAGNFTVIVTADHGGHGRNHGSKDPRDTTIPWIAWGEGVAQGAALPLHVRTMDTAATALWLLGVKAPAQWEGHAVALAFGGTYQAVAN